MLTKSQSRRAASVLVDRYGDVAIAAAMLRAQEAARHGRFVDMANWRRIAAAALQLQTI